MPDCKRKKDKKGKKGREEKATGTEKHGKADREKAFSNGKSPPKMLHQMGKLMKKLQTNLIHSYFLAGEM